MRHSAHPDAADRLALRRANAASTPSHRQTLRAVRAPVRRAPAVKAHGCQIDGRGCWQRLVGQHSEQRGVHSPRKEDEHRRRSQSGSCCVATACGCSAARFAGPSCCAVRAAMSCIPTAICHAPHARQRACGRRTRTVLVHALAAQCDCISEQLQHALRCRLHLCSVIRARCDWSNDAACALVSAQARPKRIGPCMALNRPMRAKGAVRNREAVDAWLELLWCHTPWAQKMRQVAIAATRAKPSQ